VSVVASLLRAIDRADGEALVMHVGEKPYVVTANGHAELAAKPLTIPAMTGMLDQLLPLDSRHALDELGAVEYHLPPQPGAAPGTSYTVVAARGGDDIWIEVRRQLLEPEPDVAHVPAVQGVQAVPEPAVPAVHQVHAVHGGSALAVAVAEPDTYVLETSGPIVLEEPVPTGTVEIERDSRVHEPAPHAEPIVAVTPAPTAAPQAQAVEPQPVAFEPAYIAPVDELPGTPSAEASFGLYENHVIDDPHAFEFGEAPFGGSDEPHIHTLDARHAVSGDGPHAADVDRPYAITAHESVITADEPARIGVEEQAVTIEPVEAQVSSHPVEEDPITANEDEAFVIVAQRHEPVTDLPGTTEPDAGQSNTVSGHVAPVVEAAPQVAAVHPVPEAAPEHIRPVEAMPVHAAAVEAEPETPARVAPVCAAVPVQAAPAPEQAAAVRVDSVPVATQARGEGLPHLLQVAAAQGASVLYVAVQARPSLRVDGEIRVLEHETPLTEALLEEGLKAILPNGTAKAAGEVETCDVIGVGRVQCLSFRDHRGLGAMFKMLPARAISSEQMGLGAPIQALCTETEGLVLVAGARGAGKSTLVSALVDQINRTRRDHVITIEEQIQFVHENRQSFVSQREAREDEAFAEAVRSSLREGPDVLVVDPVASSEAAAFALHAAASGHLVIASITAPTTAGAVSRFMEFFGEDRAQALLTLSEHLRGVITQSLLRKTGGGRAAAREVLVNVPSVAALIAGARFDEVGSVLNGGRRVGMVPLNDALLALVQSGALDVREAYRKSPDQQEFVGQLDRAGLDTTFTERSA
jgi:twitching motility protein PilT